jgi:gliding motility-associated-like protein
MNRLRLLLLFFMAFSAQTIFATHYRAGEVIYKLIGTFTYEVKVITYADDNAADRDTIFVNWGDGTPDQSVVRNNGPLKNGVPNGEKVKGNIKYNLYTVTHTYPGVPPAPNNFYIVSFADPARLAGIINMSNSVETSFYLEDTIKFPADIASLGYNNSPILLRIPLDIANIGDTFYHNPNAYDIDGDSLTYELIPPKMAKGLDVINFQYPDKFPADPSINNFTINPVTGLITWATPQIEGIYNVAILIREYRRGILMGTLFRDMQIEVSRRTNSPPQIGAIKDTCVRAGDPLTLNINCTDPDAGQKVTLTADGGPFRVPQSQAVFTAQPPGNPATGTFNWQTVCSHIRKQPYSVVFAGEDNFTIGQFSYPLVDLETWQIEVIAPPPTGVTANALGNSVSLTWNNPYGCSSFNNFRGFSVWRRDNSNPFIPSYCETGLDGRGYTRLNAQLIKTYSYTDNTVVRGRQYCYRILAHFSQLSPNGIFEYDIVLSVPSDEACVRLPLSIPVMTNASVTATSAAAGANFVAWSKPKAGPGMLDTIQNPPPYEYRVYGNKGFSIDGSQQLLQTYTANSYYLLNDTTLNVASLNTEDNANTYKVALISNGDSLGESNSASSLFLSIKSLDKALRLTWQASVPWINDSIAIFRQNKATLLFDSIAVTKGQSYIDTGLINDSVYCYKVKSFGSFPGLAGIKFPLINDSQEKCGVPNDTVAPCPPVLKVANDCDKYQNVAWADTLFRNYLSWSFNIADSCDNDAVAYRIYYAPDSTNFVLLDSTTDSSYVHAMENNLSGCYAVTAVDNRNNESIKSNLVCIDNCPFYNLPNVFTPNGNGQNDVYHPFRPYRFVSRVEFSVYSRWGNKVFETTDPEINWDGRDYKTGVLLSDGVYLYGGYYFEKQRGKEVRKALPPNNKGGSFIHIIKGK